MQSAPVVPLERRSRVKAKSSGKRDDREANRVAFPSGEKKGN